jgi:hypothetical protein
MVVWCGWDPKRPGKAAIQDKSSPGRWSAGRLVRLPHHTFRTHAICSKLGSWYAGIMKVTIDLKPDLYRAVKVEAARTDRSVRDIVDEALEAWLEAAEAEEDRASAQAALQEYRRDGGEAAESFFGSLAAEIKATYRTGEG